MKKLFFLVLVVSLMGFIVGCGGDGNIFDPPTTAEITFVVTVPDNTPADATIYIVGALPDATWDPGFAGYALTKNSDGTYSGTFSLNLNTAVEYKFTRGTWDDSEKAADGSEIQNRSISPTADATVECTVGSWADLPLGN